jgi:uncharacterized protein (DUF1697 family)
MFKILCTGNPEHIGIAMEIKKLFPDSTFVSRTNGYDLSTDEGLAKLRTVIKEHNVVVNNAYVSEGTQARILTIAKEEWTTGHAFNIGSIDEYSKWLPANPRKYKESNELKELGLSYTDENFKVTHLTVGGFKSSAKPLGLKTTMDPVHIATAIKWIMEAPFQVPVIGVEQMTDTIRNWYDLKRKGLESQFTG